MNMRLRLGVCLCALLRLALGSEEQVPLGKEICDRDPLNLVAYVLPSELNSQNLKDELEAVQQQIDTPIVTIDCAQEPESCEGKSITQYPMIEARRSERVITEYQGPRTREAILKFIGRAKRHGASPWEVYEETLEDFKVIDDAVFVAFLDENESVAIEAFQRMVEKYWMEFSFGILYDPEFNSTEGGQKPVMASYKQAEHDSQLFPLPGNDKALESFILEASRPVIGELMQYNHQRLLDRGWPMVYIFANTEAERADLRGTLRKFAKGYYDTLTSVTVDPLYFPDLPEKLGLVPGRFPAGAVHQLSKNRVYPYPYDRGLTSNDLSKWGIDVWQGKVKPWTPPGVTTTYEDLGPTMVSTRKFSVRNVPGMKIKVAGHNHDEL